VSAPARVAGVPPCILIVDDERHNRQLLEAMLAPEGFHLLAAASGAEALAIVERHHPDVILLDVMMPETDGYRVADAIKGRLATKNIPIIMITALDNREARIQALSAGAEDFLTKPVDRAELCMRVRNLSRLKAYGDHYEKLDRMKSEFISTVSHELRTPLTSIRGSLGLVRGGAAGVIPEKAAQLIDIAYQNTVRLALIVDDILNMEQIDRGELSLALSSQCLATLLEQAAEENLGVSLRYQVRLVLTRPLPKVAAKVDTIRILQVLANLLSNAAKFSPADASIELGLAVIGTHVRISVTDHGPGIPASFRERIFHKFSQADGSDSRQKGGTGLGLAISKALIERMGGTIDYETDPGIATTFFVELPVARPAAPPHRPVVIQSIPPMSPSIPPMSRDPA
jgi:signal transduction histidine kinase